MRDRCSELEAKIRDLGGPDTVELVDLRNELAWELRYADAERGAALAEATLVVADRLEYTRGRGFALLACGQCHAAFSGPLVALEYLERARRLFEEIDDPRGLAQSCTGIGICEEQLGRYESAAAWYTRGLGERERIGDRAGMAMSLNNCGVVYLRLGDYATALEYYYRGLALAEELDAALVLGLVLNNIGDIFCKLNELDVGLEYLHRALAIHRRNRSEAQIGQTLLNVGVVHGERGAREAALACYEEALAAVRRAGARGLEAEVLGELGRFYGVAGDDERALCSSTASLEIAKSIGNTLAEARALVVAGATLGRLGESERSAEAVGRALELGRELGSNDLVYEAHLELSRVHERAGRASEALAHYKAFHESRERVHGEQATRRIKALLVRQERELARRESDALRTANEELTRALSEVRTLRGMLPICSYCKSIRDDQNYWTTLEHYLSEHTDASLSHGICPGCYERVVEPQLREFRQDAGGPPPDDPDAA